MIFCLKEIAPLKIQTLNCMSRETNLTTTIAPYKIKRSFNNHLKTQLMYINIYNLNLWNFILLKPEINLPKKI